MSDILKKILATKEQEILERSSVRPMDQLRSECADMPAARGFIASIEQRTSEGHAAVICEIKKASPSKGVIRPDFSPAEIAADYSAHGAACLSVLTDEQYFQGHDRFIEVAKSACDLPVLRKDFTIDTYQVFEARVIGADAILLIVAALNDEMLLELSETAADADLDVLVEVHNREELERALKLPCRLIGINNRNLRTFETTLDTTFDMLDMIPEDRILVTESGIREERDVYLMQRHGVNAFLVGETFMRAPSPGAKLQEVFRDLG